MTHQGGAGRRGGDDGSAVVDFVFVSVLVLVILMGLLQLGFSLYVRNTVSWAASEGARAGARLHSAPSVGVQRTQDLIAQSLSGGYAQGVTATDLKATTDNGVDVVEVQVTAPLPVIGLWGPKGMLTVTGRAFAENQS